MTIVVHILNALLVFAIARRIAGLPLVMSTFAAALFAVLPIQAETVAWLQGLSDSVPTVFYLATFLAYATWRNAGQSGLYWIACVLFTLALFSKQSAITMVPILIAYDMLIWQRSPRVDWSSIRPYVPFCILTLGYLVERYILFGTFVRENQFSLLAIIWRFGTTQVAALQMLVFGAPLVWGGDMRRSFGPIAGTLWAGLGICGALVAISFVWIQLRRWAQGPAHPTGRLVFFFAPVWWIICTTPLAVTYETPRHLYLASAGLAVALGLGLNVLWQTPRRLWRYLIPMGGALLVVACALTLQRPLAEWNNAAAISEQIVRDTEREATAAPVGSLLILGAPHQSIPTGGWKDRIWIWNWALPFAVRPPFTQIDLTERVHLVHPLTVYCCQSSRRLQEQWLSETRQLLDTWSMEADHPPVIVLRWDASTGALARQSDLEVSALREQVLSLVASNTVEGMERQVYELLDQVTAAGLTPN